MVFQSSSSPKTGCYMRNPAVANYPYSFNPHPVRRLDATSHTPGYRQGNTRFNPHPVRRLDATANAIVLRSNQMARFNPHPVRRLDATCFQTTCRVEPALVSILIQSEDWMLLSPHIFPLLSLMFQSSSSPKTGCYILHQDTISIPCCFNPHPVRRLDATHP